VAGDRHVAVAVLDHWNSVAFGELGQRLPRLRVPARRVGDDQGVFRSGEQGRHLVDRVAVRIRRSSGMLARRRVVGKPRTTDVSPWYEVYIESKINGICLQGADRETS
ncbi:MAG: hypothetical protein O6837_06675, partial [Deltaproteobacteria bacterium]|nr:hypothetical protein [Deltaproteobacteria bacterium]